MIGNLVWINLVIILGSLITAHGNRVPLIILGMDGYGYEAYKQHGNKSHHVIPLQPVFPTLSFTNFYSISTGLYPSQHGIISNVFYNKQHNATFIFENNQHQDFDWYKGEPIWITAKKAGLRVYTHMWMGATATYGGITPDYVTLWNPDVEFEEKVQELITTMDDDETRCDLYMTYYDKPDNKLHFTDLNNSTAVKEIYRSAEDKISQLIASLGDREYNLIVVSDHGMASVDQKYGISNELAGTAALFIGGPVGLWYTKAGDDVDAKVLEITEELADSGLTGVQVIRTSDLPDRYNMCELQDSSVLPDILVVTGDNDIITNYLPPFLAIHGFDNDREDMLAHMRVFGPGFNNNKPDTESTTIKNTELYNLFCYLLDITPAPNTGHPDTFNYLVSSTPNTMEYTRIAEPCSRADGGLIHSWWWWMVLLVAWWQHDSEGTLLIN